MNTLGRSCELPCPADVTAPPPTVHWDGPAGVLHVLSTEDDEVGAEARPWHLWVPGPGPSGDADASAPVRTCAVGTSRYGLAASIVLPIVSIRLLIVSPRKIIDRIATMAINARMSAYSARPCPSSSRDQRWAKRRSASLNVVSSLHFRSGGRSLSLSGPDHPNRPWTRMGRCPRARAVVRERSRHDRHEFGEDAKQTAGQSPISAVGLEAVASSPTLR